jgi:Protein of unknown function (DUF4232)
MRNPGTTQRRPPSLAVGAVGLVVGFVLAGCSILGSATPTPLASVAGASPATSASPTLPPSPSPEPTPSPTPTPVAAIPLCNPAKLAARITAWDSGAGHRTAHVEVTNTAGSTCHIRMLDQLQLIDGHGSVLINGASPASSTFITITPGGVLKTLVDDDNYCGPAPLAPVSVAFIYPGGVGRFVATPLSPTDLSGVPPCFGAPGSVGAISMLPWGP